MSKKSKLKKLDSLIQKAESGMVKNPTGESDEIYNTAFNNLAAQFRAQRATLVSTIGKKPK